MTRRARRRPRSVRAVRFPTIPVPRLPRRLTLGAALLLACLVPAFDGAGAKSSSPSTVREIDRMVDETFRG
jgi:hypothetical protein